MRSSDGLTAEKKFYESETPGRAPGSTAVPRLNAVCVIAMLIEILPTPLSRRGSAMRPSAVWPAFRRLAGALLLDLHGRVLDVQPLAQPRVNGR